jgi:C-terminal processing protease CtpA/Prc
MTAKLKDGHIAVNRMAGNTNRFMPPIAWEWVEGKLVLTHVLNNTVNLHQGDVVTSINGEAPTAYFNNAKQYISAATPGLLNYRAQVETLRGINGSALSLTVIDSNNAKQNVTLNRDLSYFDYYKAYPAADSIKSISKDIMYLNIGLVHMKTIIAAMPQLIKCKAIICDLRGYPKDTAPFIEYLLTQKDTVKDWMQIPHIIYPDQENLAGYDKSGWEIPPLSPHLNAKIIFIIDGEDISYAESYMGLIEHYKLATIIGQPTAGTNGNTNDLRLPGGYFFSWTGMKVLKLDGSQHHGIGTKPDIYLTKTIKGIRQNKDEFLAKAIEMAETNDN